MTKATNTGWAGHEKWDLDYSFGRKPTYIMLDENLVEEDIAQSWRLSSLSDAIRRNYPACRYITWMRDNDDFIHENYWVKTVWMEDELNGEEGYFAFLELKPPTEREKQ